MGRETDRGKVKSIGRGAIILHDMTLVGERCLRGRKRRHEACASNDGKGVGFEDEARDALVLRLVRHVRGITSVFARECAAAVVHLYCQSAFHGVSSATDETSCKKTERSGGDACQSCYLDFLIGAATEESRAFVESNADVKEEEEIIEEVHFFFHAAANGSLFGNRQSDNVFSLPAYRYLLNLRCFLQVYRFVRRQASHRVSAPSSLCLALRDLERTEKDEMEENELKKILEAMDPLVRYAFRNDHSDWKDDNKDTDPRVSLLRKALRLAQFASSDEEYSKNKHVQNIMTREYLFVLPCRGLVHSCIPNCAVQATTTVQKYDGGDATVLCTLVALHDLSPGNILTVCRIDATCSYAMRALSLRRLFGPSFTCTCPRCLHEGGGGTVNMLNLRRLGNQAMQHGRFDDAVALYSLILVQDSQDGDALHARAAAHLNADRYGWARCLWQEAFDICPRHPQIALQHTKSLAYDISRDSAIKSAEDDRTGTFAWDKYSSFLGGRCFLTTAECPVILAHECARAILWSEQAASLRPGGWTTSRHHAVPTTDLPVHEIPFLLPWFVHTFHHQICPLLANQFGEDAVGNQGGFVQLHDAFVVKYDADHGDRRQRRRHLPVHRDESEISLTLSLNEPRKDYIGGGTYLAKLGQSLAPSRGGMLSFRGQELLHGGDPVMHGVRYVIVAFCYIVRDDDMNKQIANTMKNVESDDSGRVIDRSKICSNKIIENGGDVSFSFGFEL